MLLLWVYVLGIYVLAAAALSWVVATRVRLSKDPLTRLWDMSHRDAPADARSALDEYEPPLATLGFGAASGITTRHTAMEHVTHVACFRAPNVVAEVSINPKVPARLSFWSLLSDERLLVTTTVDPKVSHLFVPKLDTLHFLPPMPLPRLFTLHRRACSAHRVLPLPADVAQFVAHRTPVQLRFMVAKGFYVDRGPRLGHSISSSVVFALSWLPPGRWAIAFVDRLLARRLERKLARIEAGANEAASP